MKRLGLIVVAVILMIGFLSALYMQANLCKGEPHILAPHEYKPEITKKLHQKDFFFVPLWVMIFTLTIFLGYSIFKLFVSEHSYYSTILYITMIGIYLVATFALFKAYGVVGDAQVWTGKTAEFVVGFFDLMKPFIIIIGLCGVNELIKRYNKSRVPEDSVDIQRFNILKSILKNRHQE